MDVPGQLGVRLLVNLDNRVEQLRDALSVAAHGGAHGHAQQPAQLLDIQLVAFVLKFIVHVQRHHGAQVHVDELGGQVQVALDVGGVHHVDDHVRHGLQEVFADVELLRGVGAERVGAWEVHQGDIVTLELEMAFLGIHGDAGVVAHVLVAAGGNVEQGGFAAVGVAHQRNADIMVPFLRHMGQGAVQALFIFQVSGQGLQVFIRPEGLAGFLVRHHLNLPGLFPPEGHFIADNLVFDGVLEGGVEHHADLFSLNEAHLYQAFTETPVTVHTNNHGVLACLQI